MNDEIERDRLPTLDDVLSSESVENILYAIHKNAQITIPKDDPVVYAALLQAGVMRNLLAKQFSENDRMLEMIDERINAISAQLDRAEAIQTKMQETIDKADVFLEAAKRLIIERAELEGKPLNTEKKKFFGMF